MIIETLKLVGKWYLLPFLLLINKKKALDAFNRVALKAVSPTLLKDECLTNFSRETKRFIEVFVSKLGLTGGDQLAIIVSNLIDYDNAYRLRLEDVLSETSKYRLLKNPRKEIRRLVGILKERETLRCEIKNTNIHYKFKVTAWLFSLALLIPKFNRAFKEAIEQSNFENFQYDEIDMYWVSMRTDFLWLGLTNEERLEFANKKGWKFPKPITLA
jgi:hypothetical protein